MHNRQELKVSITVLAIEETDLYPGVNFTKEVDLSHMKGGYQLLLEVHDGNEDVIIAARGKNGKIRDFNPSRLP